MCVCVFKPNAIAFILMQERSRDSDCCQVLHYSSLIPLSLSLSLSMLVMVFLIFSLHLMFTTIPQHLKFLSVFLLFCPLSLSLSRSLSLIPSAAFLAVGSSYPHNGSNSLSKGNMRSVWCFICLFSTHLSYSRPVLPSFCFYFWASIWPRANSMSSLVC